VSTGDRKRELRRRVLAQRDALSVEEIERRSAEIARRVMELECYRAARTRLLFASFGSEVCTDSLLTETADMAPWMWGIREPFPLRCPTVSLSEVDFILVPGVAFDRRGGRLGYGGGFYDRILRERSDLVEAGAVVAVTFALQIVDEVPRDERDVLVPVIVTENEIIRIAS